MEPTPEGGAQHRSGIGSGDGARSELAPSVTRRHPARAALASLIAIALLAAGIGVMAATRHHDAAPLVLSPGGRVPEKGTAAPAAFDSGLMPFPTYHYRLAIAPPDLGSSAPVARLVAPPVDAARVGSLAAAVGFRGAVHPTPGGAGWEVSDGAAQLLLEPTPGGWSLSYTPNAADSAPGAIPGSGGSAGSGRATDAGGTTVVPPVPLPTDTVPTDTVPPPAPAPPANLPDTGEAERIARALLERMGISGDWSVTVDPTTSGDGVACAPEPCAVPDHIVLTSRSVEIHPRFAGVEIDGLSWHVEVGNEGQVLGVSGTWSELRTLGRYPLRSVDAVFADLAAGRGIDPEPVPVAAMERGGVVPLHEIAPVSVTIDHVALGLAVMPAFDNGGAVVDVVPTYVFSGTTSAGDQVSRSLVAVEASVSTPSTAPGSSTTPPDGTGGGPTSPPLGKPEPQPMPVAPPPTVVGTPPT